MVLSASVRGGIELTPASSMGVLSGALTSCDSSRPSPTSTVLLLPLAPIRFLEGLAPSSAASCWQRDIDGRIAGSEALDCPSFTCFCRPCPISPLGPDRSWPVLSRAGTGFPWDGRGAMQRRLDTDACRSARTGLRRVRDMHRRGAARAQSDHQAGSRPRQGPSRPGGRLLRVPCRHERSLPTHPPIAG
jgi:hypothetical protein